MSDFLEALHSIDTDQLAYVEATSQEKVMATAELEASQLASREAAGTARNALKGLLSTICEDPQRPLVERAAWSAAFNAGTNDLTGVNSYTQKAESYYNRLTSIDQGLQEQGDPILGIVTGDLGDRFSNSETIRYAFAYSAGSGLTLRQHRNGSNGAYGHIAQAAELPTNNRHARHIHDSLRIHRTPDSKPIIANISAGDLVDGAINPVEIAKEIESRTTPNGQRYFLIGNKAITNFFEHASGTKAEEILGHATYMGFRFSPES